MLRNRSRMRLGAGRVGLATLFLIATACSDPADDGAASEPASEPTSVASTDDPAPAVEPDPVLISDDHEFTLEHGGRERSYIVHVPAGLEHPAPMVVALHGGGGTGKGFQEQNGMDVVADREGFLVVYPEGTGVLPNRLHTWNSGFNCCGYALDNDVDDVGFLRAVIEDVAERTAVERGRVYMTGHSNGAMMSYRFAAEAADLVTAIAPVGGALSVADPSPTRAIAVLHIHSADDPRALYDGGEGPPFPGTSRTHVAEPVRPGIETWATINGCSPGPVLQQTLVGTGDDEGQTAERLVWDCAEEASVEHLLLTGSGHGWPGTEVGRIWQSQLGPSTTLIDASEEVWAFVSRFARS